MNILVSGRKYYVIIPVYNEEKHILKVISNVKKYNKNIIVVNDGSTDNTQRILKKIKNIVICDLKINAGKGRAMKIGANRAWKLGAGGIIYIDGDGQHNASHIPEFIKGLWKNDIVIGIRILKAKMPLYRRIGNELFILFMKSLFDVKLGDLICGFRALTKKGFKQVKWTSENYGVEAEMITIIGRKKLPYSTVIVDTIYLDKYKGFSVQDGIKILFRLPLWRIRKI